MICRALVSLLLLMSPRIGAAQESVAPAATVIAGDAATLTQEQLRTIIRQAAEKDIENNKTQNRYTYIQREEEHKLDGAGGEK